MANNNEWEPLDRQEKPQVQYQRQPQRQNTERRRKKDWVVRLISLLSVVGWIAAIVVLFFLDKAKPESANFFTNIFNLSLHHTTWNTSLVRTALIIQVAVLAVCVLGFLFNMTRHRRKSDKYNRAIIILGVVSVVSIVLFLVNFGNLL
ncbi:MAG: hypothetical protein LBN00_08105 [Oscillospiraceae bacterium]|jgi:magnesium-transporting ATPase (P-type)|nr:hypothetical protein [Oscillospiraceae bacterium]